VVVIGLSENPDNLAKVEGKYQNNPVKGMGYVELTGYAKAFSKGI